MTNKVQQAKDEQGYVKSPRSCGTCTHYKFEAVHKNTEYHGIIVEEKNKRCGIGGFAVQVSSSCHKYERKE